MMEVKNLACKGGWRQSVYAAHSTEPSYYHLIIFILTGLSIFGRLIFVFYRPKPIIEDKNLNGWIESKAVVQEFRFNDRYRPGAAGRFTLDITWVRLL